MRSAWQRIPRPTAQRLSLYLRELQLMLAEGNTTVSSKELGAALGISSAKVRKDLAWAGEAGSAAGSQKGRVGRSGVGYDCAGLRERIRGVIGTNRKWRALLVGCGNIGRALIAYGGFEDQGFEIVAVVDSDRRVVGKRIGGLVVGPATDLRKALRSSQATIAIVAVPRSAAQAVASQLCSAGVRGILNFAPMRLSVAHGVSVTNIDVNVALEQLAMDISLIDQADPSGGSHR